VLVRCLGNVWTCEDVPANVSDQPVREKEIEIKKDEIENSVASHCSSAVDLPDIFVCFNQGSLHPRRYMRLGKDSWDVHLWRDHWQFFDNIGDQSAVECFNEAWHKFQTIWPEECGE
jgi:hypothetical protein